MRTRFFAGTKAAILLLLLPLGCEHVTSNMNRGDAGGAADASWVSFDAGGPVNLNAISGVGENAITIVGDHGTIVRWNGTALVSESSGTDANLRGVWAVDPDLVFAVGDNGTFLERTAGKWIKVAVGVTGAALTAVWADADRVVAVGEKGVIVSRNNGDFGIVKNEGVENLLAVTGTKGGEITAAGALGVVFHISGTTLKRQVIPGFTKLLAGATTGPDAAYFVGLDGTVLEAVGGAFTPIEGFPTKALRAVAAPGAEVWVVGFEGTIARRAGGQVTKIPALDDRWLSGIYAASPNAIWIVGRSGVIVRGPPPNLPANAGPGPAVDAGASSDGGAP